MSVESGRNHHNDLFPFQRPLPPEPAMKEPVVRTICDLRELETLRAFWRYCPGTRDSDLDFFSGMIRSRPGCLPHVIVLTRDTKPDAILVGFFERRKMSFKLGHFTICEPEVKILEFVSGGLRGRASNENCAAFVHAVMRSLDEGYADMALWEEVDVQSPLYDYALRWPGFFSRDHFPCIDSHWWLTNFPDSLDAFLLSRSRSQRSKLRHKYNTVLNHFAGKMHIRCFRSATDLEAATADMEKIARKTKRRVVGSGFMDTPQLREQMAMAAASGWLRIYILYFDEQPVAFWKGTLYGGCLQGDHVGYDPFWSDFSPGIFLFLKILEGFHADGLQLVDLGFRDTQFKRYLGNLSSVESRVRIYAPTLRGSLLNLLNVACPRANDSARFLLQTARCLEWARRASRNRLVHARGRDCSTAEL